MSAAERVPGDPSYVRKLWRGELAMPAPTTARARWDARQAMVIEDYRLRNRMMLGIMNQFLAEHSKAWAEQVTLAQLRDLLEQEIENVR